jgi:hypothetical protein
MELWGRQELNRGHPELSHEHKVNVKYLKKLNARYKLVL